MNAVAAPPASGASPPAWSRQRDWLSAECRSCVHERHGQARFPFARGRHSRSRRRSIATASLPLRPKRRSEQRSGGRVRECRNRRRAGADAALVGCSCSRKGAVRSGFAPAPRSRPQRLRRHGRCGGSVGDCAYGVAVPRRVYVVGIAPRARRLEREGPFRSSCCGRRTGGSSARRSSWAWRCCTSRRRFHEDDEDWRWCPAPTSATARRGSRDPRRPATARWPRAASALPRPPRRSPRRASSSTARARRT